MTAYQALGWASGTALEALGLVVSFHGFAVMGQAVQERGGHLGIAKDGGPFAKGGLVLSMTEVRS